MAVVMPRMIDEEEDQGPSPLGMMNIPEPTVEEAALAPTSNVAPAPEVHVHVHDGEKAPKEPKAKKEKAADVPTASPTAANAPVAGPEPPPDLQPDVPAPTPQEAGVQPAAAPAIAGPAGTPTQAPAATGHMAKPYDHLIAANRGDMIALNPMDPDYRKKLAALTTHEGMLRAENAREAIMHPWGTSENHPGVLGKIGHALATVGNVAGEALAPRLVAAIPGSRANLEEQIASGEGEQKEGSKQDLEGAQAEAARNKEPKEASPDQQAFDARQRIGTPQEQPDDKAIVQAFQDQAADKKDNPDAASKTIATDKGIMQWNPKTKAYDIPAGNAPEKLGNDFEQYYHDYLTDNHLPDSAHNRLIAREAYQRAGQKPTQEPGNYLPVTNAQGQTIGYLDPKSQHYTALSSIPGVTEALPGGVMQPKPTTQARNVASQAQLVHAETPKVLAEIDSMAGELGPFMGNWNKFMQGEVGMDDPKFAGLRADLLMYSSAVALAHARGRLPENLREEFDRAINAPKQSAANLRATITKIDSWMEDNMNIMGGGETAKAPTEIKPPKAADAGMKWQHTKPGPDGQVQWRQVKQ